MPHSARTLLANLRIPHPFYAFYDDVHDCIAITRVGEFQRGEISRWYEISRREIDDNDGKIQHLADDIIRRFENGRPQDDRAADGKGEARS